MRNFATMSNKGVPKILLQLLTTTLALLIGDYLMKSVIGDYLMKSVYFDKAWVAIITAFVLGLLNAFLKPLLILLTIPATLITQ